MSLGPARIQKSIRFGEDFEFDFDAYKLRRSGRVLKLERIPMEVLLLLTEQRGEIVSREQIVEKIWGKAVFLDTDNSINGAIRKIRQVLRDDPAQPRFIQTVAGRGYRFIAPIAAPSQPGPQLVVPPQAEPPQTAPPSAAAARRATRTWQAALALAVVLIGSGVAHFLWSRSSTPDSPSPGRVMLAVLPFENLTGDPAQDYFSEGMTEEMITELGNLNPDRLGVIARTSAMLYQHSSKPVDQIGHELGVQYIIEGSVRRELNNVRITAQLIQVKDQSHVWARQYDRELKNSLLVEGEIAQEIADEIELTLRARQKPPAVRQAAATSPPTTSYEAYDLYLKGRYFWNKRTPAGFRQAAECFQQAIALDHNYARAYAGLADTYGLMSTWGQVPQNEFMPKARIAALKALAIDEKLAEAHTSLALIAESYDYDWKTAEKEFRRAIELNPEYATAHHWYAEHLAWRGRFGEALAESEHARQLDPLSLIIATDHAAILYFSRQYDRAIEQSRTVLAMDPSFSRARGFVLYGLVHEGRFTEALDQLESWSRADHATCWDCLAYLYGYWGKTAQAEQALRKYEQIVSKSEYDPTRGLLIAYIVTGRKDQAMALLQKEYSKHSNVLTLLKIDPNFDPLRNDPRFEDLLRRIGLEE